jgi:hypothetical protein
MSTSATTPRRRGADLGLFVVLVLVLVLAAVGAAPAASAHSDTATFSDVTVQPSGSSVRIDATLTYDNDDDPVTDATVTVAGDNGAGATLVPVVLVGNPEGVYSGTLDLPASGTWRLRLTSVTPTAELSVDAEVPAPAAATTVPTTAPTTVPTPGGGDAAGGVPDLVTTSSSSADDGGTSPWLWVLGGIAAVAAVAVGMVFVLRGRNQGPID